MVFCYSSDEERFGDYIQLGSEVYVTDPAYTTDLWCCNLIKEFRPGRYQPYIVIDDEKDCVAQLIIYHDDADAGCAKDKMGWRYVADIPVDSGQAGFFDKDFYAESKKADKVNTEKDFDKMTGFYKDCCVITLDDDPFGTLDSNLGVVSASGYGDGVYELYVVKDSADRIVAARIIFIEARNEDEDDDWDDEDEEDIDDEEEDDD